MQNSPYVDRTWQSRDGLRLYARDYAPAAGAARLPVICIHGLTRNSADFKDIAPWIAAQGRRVLAVDVRGRGYSSYDADPSHYNPVVYAQDVIDMAEALGIARAVFIGTSMGGLITMTLAVKKSSLIAAAVLNDVGPMLSERGLTRIKGYAGKSRPVDSWDAAAEAIKAINAPAFPDNTMEEWHRWARRAFFQDASGKFLPRYDPNIAQPLQAGKIKTSSFLAKLAFRKLARNRPTLLVRGAISDLLEDAQASYMRSAAPTMQYVEVPGIGHAPMLMEPAAQEAIRRFLDEVA